MKNSLRIFGWGVASVSAVMMLSAVEEPEPSREQIVLLGEKAEEFAQVWKEKGFPFIDPTEYRAEDTEAGVVVMGVSHAANRSMHRELRIEAPTKARLSWRWKVQSSLNGAKSERSKGGDDYAARVFVVFETSWVPTGIRAINYVWSAREPVGATFRSPYSKNVQNIVLRTTGDDWPPPDWQREERDVWADYVAAFGEPPSVLNAVAIMVDTDNTDGSAQAWFADLNLEIKQRSLDSSP